MIPMLVELVVTNLGVIESARVLFSGGLVALTGETGAGKTMLMEALGLLTGSKADPTRVRQGADEAVVEGLFADGDTEWVLRRVVPVEGRSRAYVNGALATAATLADVAGGLLELHGQHAQQQLFSRRVHRSVLDEFASIDTGPMDELTRRARELEHAIEAEGGDEGARLREIDLLRFQIEEISGVDPQVGEDRELEAEELVLADALAHREAAETALALLTDDGAVSDQLAVAAVTLEGRSPLEPVRDRLVALVAELTDSADELRRLAEVIEPDPQRLSWIQDRRSSLADLRRKYGPEDTDVLGFLADAQQRVELLASFDERLRERLEDLAHTRSLLEVEAVAVGTRRRETAPELAAAIEAHLRQLAMPDAEVSVDVSDGNVAAGDGDVVEFLISTNRGMRPGPLGKVASGGELSRVMLALHLVLSQGPPTVVFDEVDAGIGGEAATAMGRALSSLASQRQVLVVTHLPQVAAFADLQVRLEKSSIGDSVATTATALSHQERIVEISRMLSGQPDSENARRHAEELLAQGERHSGAQPIPATPHAPEGSRSGR